MEGGGPKYNNQRLFNPVNRGNFGKGRGRGNFGRGGRGPIICYNCNKSEHLDHDFPNPFTTCTYFIYLDHMIEDYPKLLTKWKARGNLNQNPNHNV
jgi:hypothetical protein